MRRVKSLALSLCCSGPAIALLAACAGELPTASGNQPPLIGVLALSPREGLSLGQAVTVTVGATDPEGDYVDYAWTASGGTLLTSTGTQVGWNPPTTPGRHTVRVLARDPSGAASAGYVSLEVVGSQVTATTPLILRPAPASSATAAPSPSPSPSASPTASPEPAPSIAPTPVDPTPAAL